jgi:hypothetical protein
MQNLGGRFWNFIPKDGADQITFFRRPFADKCDARRTLH